MDKPFSFLIDELTFLVGTAAQNDELLTADLNELVNRIARSHGVWLTLATQELFQLSEQIRQTVLSMGTVLFGQTSDPQVAKELAERYYRYDPYKVKKSRTLYGMDYRGYGRFSERGPVVVGEQTTEFTRAEQIDENSRVFLDLAPSHFLIGQSSREGELPTTLRRFTTEQVDAGEYPNKKIIASLRSQLMRRDGSKADTIRSEIANRLGQTEEVRPSQTGRLPDSPISPPSLSGSTDPGQPGSVPAADTPRTGTSPQPTLPGDAPPEAALQPPVRQGLPPLQPPKRRRRPVKQNDPSDTASRAG